VVQDVPPFVCASGNHALPNGFNPLAEAFITADIHQQQAIRTLYERLYHHAIPLDEVKKEAKNLSEKYPLVTFFDKFFSRTTRGIIR
jgi:UDP-N-acetylglucosamine acyltransferase